MKEDIFHGRLLRPILDLLRQGVTPKKIALSLALGVALGVFPLLGSTTALCAVAALVLRLNLPAIQVINYFVYPLQIALLIPFFRLGERLFRAPHLPLSVPQIYAMMHANVWDAIRSLWTNDVACHPGVVFAGTALGGGGLCSAAPGAAARFAQTLTGRDRGGLMSAQALHLATVGMVIVAAMMLVLWIIHLLIRNAAIVDVGWAAGLGILALFYALSGPGYPARKWAIASMAGFWGLRLAGYLLLARVVGHKEEGRYVQLRKDMKTNTALRFLFFFEFQALLDVVLSLPFLLACLNTRAPLGTAEKTAAAIWLIAIFGEAFADQQLSNFKRNPANQGKTFREGLWKYSRHPNYFFEWLIWVAYAVFALGSPWGWLGLLSPALILYFLLSATGIPATEAQALRTRGNEYRAYQRTTSSFVPWFPKRVTGDS
jgi:steroid 5-alpha reductase family enzyme/uncharacterized protein (DUF2062 family)